MYIYCTHIVVIVTIQQSTGISLPWFSGTLATPPGSNLGLGAIALGDPGGGEGWSHCQQMVEMMEKMEKMMEHDR
jgi:hypothetical protein